MSTDEQHFGELEAALLRQPQALALSATETPACLDAARLVQLAEGSVDASERAASMEHVAGCDRCLLGLDAAVEALSEAKASAGTRRSAWIAGAVLLATAALFLFFLSLWNRSTPPSYEWAPSLAVVQPLSIRVTRGPATTDLDRARAAYSDRLWNEVERIARASTHSNDELRLLQGSARLLLDSPRRALEVLSGIASVDDSVGRAALWNCVQADLLLERVPSAMERLQVLAESPGAHYSDAVSQLEKLQASADLP